MTGDIRYLIQEAILPNSGDRDYFLGGVAYLPHHLLQHIRIITDFSGVHVTLLLNMILR